jgi:hypothetical protein
MSAYPHRARATGFSVAGSSRRFLARIGPASGAVAVLVTLLIAGLTTGTPVVVKKPPYLGATLYSRFFLKNATGCASFAHDPVPPSFNATSGLARVVSEVGANVCASGNGSANLIGYVGATNITFSVAASGLYNVSAFWSVNATATFSTNLIGNSANFGGGVILVPNLCLTDLSSGVLQCFGAHTFGVASSASNQTISITSAFAIIVRGWSLVAGHTYDLRTFVVYHVAARAASPARSGTSITVTLDMHASGRGLGARLESVTIVH